MYDIKWPQYNGTRNGCSAATPLNCFNPNAQPCAGDSLTAESEVVANWGAQSSGTDGYWGSNSGNVIYQEVLDAIQLQPVSIGGDITTMTSGTKSAQASALDTRVNEDGDVTDNVYADYHNNAAHNERRIIALPIVQPITVSGSTAPASLVLGYGQFLLLSDASAGGTSNYYGSGGGSAKPFCAIYAAGGYCQDCKNGSGSQTTGYFTVKLVQ
jgi:hypothetical protein